MDIHGFQKLTLLDFPGRTACTVFFAGCNYRCPFCHNSLLVTEKPEAYMTDADLCAYLKKRVGLLDGVCITGGEPTLVSSLGKLCGEIKSLGYKVKLDTNGTSPDVLRELIEGGLIDYVAMDIKNSPDKYAATCGVENPQLDRVMESAAYLKRGTVGYEFRTTVTKQLHTAEDIREIGRRLGGDESYFIQNFKDSGYTIVPGMTEFSYEELCVLLAAAREFFPNAHIRGYEEE